MLLVRNSRFQVKTALPHHGGSGFSPVSAHSICYVPVRRVPKDSEDIICASIVLIPAMIAPTGRI